MAIDRATWFSNVDLNVRLERTGEASQTPQTGIAEARRQSNDHAAGEMTGFLQARQ